MRSRAFLAFYEAAFVSLPWFFHPDWLLRVEIPGSPEMILSAVQHRRWGILFPLVWLSYPALLLAAGLSPSRSRGDAVA